MSPLTRISHWLRHIFLGEEALETGRAGSRRTGPHPRALEMGPAGAPVALTGTPRNAPGALTNGAVADPEVMQRIGHLELISRVVVDGLLAGKHRSTHRGGCSEFAQHRPYTMGDDPRTIDWQVYARNDRHVVRQFEEETNLQAILALDTSGSMGFGMSTGSKLEYAVQAGACLARLLLRQRDAVGLSVLHDQQPLFIPPRQNASHMQSVLSALAQAAPAETTTLSAQIRSCIPRMRRRGMFILLSDCFGDTNELGISLRLLRARGHEVTVVQVLAPEEIEFDFRHWSAFQSLESERKIHLDPAAIRETYLTRFHLFLDRIAHITTSIGADYLRLSTADDLGDRLSHFLRRRAARDQSAPGKLLTSGGA